MCGQLMEVGDVVETGIVGKTTQQDGSNDHNVKSWLGCCVTMEEKTCWNDH
jgi:hypothetical protein